MSQIQIVPPLDKDLDDASVAKLVQSIIESAMSDRASDIHIEPYQEKLLVRARIDGRLSNYAEYPSHLTSGIVSRIKVLARMNIIERRRPQEALQTAVHD